MKKVIEIQQENPELRVIPMVDQEIVNSDDYCY